MGTRKILDRWSITKTYWKWIKIYNRINIDDIYLFDDKKR